MCGEEDRGHAKAFLDISCRAGSVAAALEPHVHQHKVRLMQLRCVDRRLFGGDDVHDRVAAVSKRILDIGGCDGLVFDDENAGSIHRPIILAAAVGESDTKLSARRLSDLQFAVNLAHQGTDEPQTQRVGIPETDFRRESRAVVADPQQD